MSPFTDPLKAVSDAEALVLATEWPEFREVDFEVVEETMHSPIIFDGRMETHLIPRVLQVALGEAACVEVFGSDYPTPDGTCIRDYIHVRDLAQAHILALSASKSDTYNLGGGTSVKEVIDTCREITGHEIPVEERPRRPGDPPRLVAASDRAREQLGWKPEFQNISAIVESAWNWHKKYPRGYPD